MSDICFVIDDVSIWWSELTHNNRPASVAVAEQILIELFQQKKKKNFNSIPLTCSILSFYINLCSRFHFMSMLAYKINKNLEILIALVFRVPNKLGYYIAVTRSYSKGSNTTQFLATVWDFARSGLAMCFLNYSQELGTTSNCPKSLHVCDLFYPPIVRI